MCLGSLIVYTTPRNSKGVVGGTKCPICPLRAIVA
jgi:hypothetical protein